MNPHDLIPKHLDASLTADEAAALAAAMAENPALAEEFAASTRMETALGEALRESARTALYTRRLERAVESLPAPRPVRKWPLRQAGIAAGLAALLGGAWWVMPSRLESPAALAGEKKKSAPKVTESPAPLPAFTGGVRVARVESAALKRTLRQFYGSGGNLRSVPVSHAVAALEEAWKAHAPRDLAAIPIRLDDKVRQRYTKPEDEPAVSLEIPGVSLLTNLNLLAAQAGLKTVVTGEAITLEPDPRPDDGQERTWTLPLDQPTLAAFIQRTEKSAALASWMPVVLTDNRVTQPVFATRWLAPMGNTVLGDSFIEPTEFDPPQIPQVFGDDQTVAAVDWQEKLHTALPLWEQLDNPPGSVDFDAFREIAGLPAACPSTQQTAACINCHQPADTQVPVQEYAMRNAAREELLATLLSGQREAAGALDANAQRLAERFLSLQANNGKTLALINPTAANPGESLYFPVQPNADDYGIDLNVAPEVIHFEGFINYGEPIQTTGFVNSISRDPQSILLNVLCVHGFPQGWTPQLNTAGINGALYAVLGTQRAHYDAASGQVTATGSLTQLRAASAVIEALREAATSGFEAKVRVVDWPADAAATVTGDSVAVVTEGEWQQAVKRGRGTVTASQSARFRPDESPTVQAGSDTQITFSGCKILAGTEILAGIAVNSSPHQTIVGVPVTMTPVNYKISSGLWLRYDLPSHDNATARTVLVSMQPAAVPVP